MEEVVYPSDRIFLPKAAILEAYLLQRVRNALAGSVR